MMLKTFARDDNFFLFDFSLSNSGGDVIKAISERNYVVSKYVVGEDGRFSPLLPNECPAQHIDVDRPCDIALNHQRSRKTGPHLSFGSCSVKHTG